MAKAKYTIKRKEILIFEVEAYSKPQAQRIADEAGDMDYKMEVEEITNEVIGKTKGR